MLTHAPSPYDPDNAELYVQWREAKLHDYPRSLSGLVVTIRDPRQLRASEYAAMLACLRKTNMVIYAGATGADPDKAIPRILGERFGLTHLNHNWLADDDGLTSLTVNAQGEHPTYIPYTNRPIKWHTDGYYNSAQTQIRGLMLHCVHPAAEGGANALLDNDIAYIRLRDINPDYIRALMQPDAMTIPPGTDMHGKPRRASVGPVFSITPEGELHMRYTARKRNIEWSGDPLVQEAVKALEQLLDSNMPEIFHGRLEAGMGLVCNNVLHDRSGFSDHAAVPRRLLYRARYYDRVAETGFRFV